MRLVVALAVLVTSCGGTPDARRDPAMRAHAPSRRADRPPRDAGAEQAMVVSIEPGTTVDTRPAIDVIEGRVSYYADSLAGRSTATGEPYDPTDLTAASRDLPFGTVVRVIRVDTGASVVVRINDRGPFGRRTRILDLSRAAAEALDMIRAGVIEVRAEILERGPSRH